MDYADGHFADLLKAGLPRQLCLTWCQGDDPDRVARAFGADMGGGLWADSDELEELKEEHLGELLQLTPVDGWVIALEPNGFEGARKEVLTRLSQGRQALSVCWNVELDSAVTYAVDGDIVTTFNLIDIANRTGSAPDALDELLLQAGLRDGLPIEAIKARSLVLGEKVSGQPLTPGWLQSPQLVFTITDPLPDALVPAACLNPRMPFLDEPAFARILAASSVDMAPDIVQMVATTALTVATLEAPLSEEVRWLLNHGDQRAGQRDALRARLADRVTEIRRHANLLRSGPPPVPVEEASRLESAADATFVLVEALQSAPMTAAAAATMLAANLSLSHVDQLRMRVLRNVVRHIEYELRHH